MRYSRLAEPDYDPALVDFVRRLRALSGHPRFVRLNHNRQLGTTFLAGGLGASHSRLEHSLGVLDIALILADHLERFTERMNYSTTEAKSLQRVVLLLAFIHDAFHGPYGHTMDPIRSVIAPGCEEVRLDKEALMHFVGKACGDGTGWLYEVLTLLYQEDTGQLNDDLKMLRRLYVAREKGLAFAVEIVDSPMDADRLDYIPRDHAHIFLDNRALGTEEIARGAHFQRAGDGEVHLHFSPKSLEKIEEHLAQRLFLYDNVYEAREKAPYDEMLIHAVLYLFDDFGCGTPARSFNPDYETRVEIFEEFVQLSDDDFERVFDLVDVAPRRILSQLLVEDVRTNAPFQVVDVQPVPAAGVAAMWHRYNRLSSALRAAFADLPPLEKGAYRWGASPSEWRQRRDAAERIFAQVADAKVDIETHDEDLFKTLSSYGDGSWDPRERAGRVSVGRIENEEAYWMCMRLGDDLSAKRSYETFLWKELQRRWRSGYETWRADVKTEVVRRCREQWSLEDSTQLDALDLEVDATIDGTPLIFVFCTRISGTIIDVILRNRGEEGPVFTWQEGGESAIVQVRSTREGKASYSAMLLAPGSFSEEGVGVLRELWEESFAALDWWGDADTA